MRPTFLLSILIFALTSCDDQSAVADNLDEERTLIIVKEGEAVILVPETDRSMMIAAGVLRGKLSVTEIDPHGRNFGVTWNDAESWETSTIVSDESGGTVILLDKDGDGLPNLKIESPGGGQVGRRFEFENALWKELPSSLESGE